MFMNSLTLLICLLIKHKIQKRQLTNYHHDLWIALKRRKRISRRIKTTRMLSLTCPIWQDREVRLYVIYPTWVCGWKPWLYLVHVWRDQLSRSPYPHSRSSWSSSSLVEHLIVSAQWSFYIWPLYCHIVPELFDIFSWCLFRSINRKKC